MPVLTRLLFLIGFFICASVVARADNDRKIDRPDCGGIVAWAGTSGAIKLPPASSFTPPCAVKVCNLNPNDVTGHGALLIGFPDPSLPHLWMRQCETVELAPDGKTWLATSIPGRFRPAFTPDLYVDAAGDDSNDGLVSNDAGSALKDPQRCWAIWQWEMDLDGKQPHCLLTGGQSFDGGLFCRRGGGGTAVYFLSGNGGQATLRNSPGDAVVMLADFCGYIIFENVKLDLTTSKKHPMVGIFNHQQNGFDTGVGVTIVGGDLTDIGIYSDSVGKLGIGGTPTFVGQFSNLIEGDLLTPIYVGHGLTIGPGTRIKNSVIAADASSPVRWDGPLNLPGGSSTIDGYVFSAANKVAVEISSLQVNGTIGGALKQWRILNGAVLCNTSPTVVPGAAGVNSGVAGASDGVIAAPVSGNCGP